MLSRRFAVALVCFASLTTLMVADAIDLRNLRGDNGRDSEQRANIFSASTLEKLNNLKSTAVANRDTEKWHQVDDWFGRMWTPAQVKAELNLSDKFGKVLKSDVNYQFYQGFLVQFEGKLDGSLKNDLPPSNVWSMLGLENFPWEQGHAQLMGMKHSKEVKMYIKYADMYDDKVIRSGLPLRIPGNELVFKTTEQEYLVRTAMWVTNNRPEGYVKKALGLEGLSDRELTDNTNYFFLKSYREEMLKRAS